MVEQGGEITKLSGHCQKVRLSLGLETLGIGCPGESVFEGTHLTFIILHESEVALSYVILRKKRQDVTAIKHKAWPHFKDSHQKRASPRINETQENVAGVDNVLSFKCS